MPAVDVDRETAADAAQRELAKPIYEHPSPLDRFATWLAERLDDLEFRAGHVPGGWFTILVTTLIVIAVVVLLVRIARRSVRTKGADFGLFESGELTAAQHRVDAELAASQGDWASAIRHRLRAVARQLEERTILTPVPGRTANELATDAGRELPSLSQEFRSCAEIFNDVSYGDRPGTLQSYRQIADLDDHIRDAPVLVGSAKTDAATGWEAVR
ncbi:DUF4129 domain-containing protein [Mycobacterium sp. CBMA271]|uniref:DUF4129 domain-containing protein n=1 Tax=unclassified Mycobacteroides TaxID=2618759 RepID=UPI0012DBDA12|nr:MULTISPECIES: DUF4129 domain-containing protein [unclassified Mycobacteroides]MUM19663.1 hypothetical protein [Mycobacteroides sp. CBMA 326]MUM24265.1 DUF4129 domain-containing protein [Mycobacteroides sp. CBMA 271]